MGGLIGAYEKVIRQFKVIKTEDEWDKLFSKFKKEVEHHAHEEEHKLFPNVREILDKKELVMIGSEMRKFKNKFKKKKAH